MKRKSPAKAKADRATPSPIRRLDLATIVSMGLHLTRRVPLQDVSIVRIARELKVSPGSVHYHLKGRSSLTTGIINQFYREMLERWPTPQGSWKSDVIAMATELHDHFCDYPGVAAYYVQHNRYDVLIPATSVEGGGVAMKFFEKYLSTFENSGTRARAYGNVRGHPKPVHSRHCTRKCAAPVARRTCRFESALKSVRSQRISQS